MHPDLSIIMPAKNEAVALAQLLPTVQRLYPDAEIILVNDGSADDTASVSFAAGAKVVSHPYSMGNGASIKAGARIAKGATLVFMDADGQHDPDDIGALLAKLGEGYDMVVGAREGVSQASVGRRIANYFYNRLASLMTGHEIRDLTSGFRAAKADKFKRFLYLLPNGFSYPTTITMAFFRSAYSVAYVPIRAHKRVGKSKISVLKDGLRFFVIILKIGALFSPMRLFLPVSAILFLLGLGYYTYTYLNWGRFTNMSALLFIAAVFTFLIGIISEQVSSLHYKDSGS